MAFMSGGPGLVLYLRGQGTWPAEWPKEVPEKVRELLQHASVLEAKYGTVSVYDARELDAGKFYDDANALLDALSPQETSQAVAFLRAVLWSWLRLPPSLGGGPSLFVGNECLIPALLAILSRQHPDDLQAVALLAGDPLLPAGAASMLREWMGRLAAATGGTQVRSAELLRASFMEHFQRIRQTHRSPDVATANALAGAIDILTEVVKMDPTSEATVQTLTLFIDHLFANNLFHYFPGGWEKATNLMDQAKQVPPGTTHSAYGVLWKERNPRAV